MRTITSLLALFFLSSSALAQSAISISPMKGEKAVEVVETKNMTGSCGTAVVRVLGIANISDNYYSIELDTAKIIVRAGASQAYKELVLDTGNVLSDFNGVSCVATKSGHRLLVWSNCAGSSCPADFSFYVIDPNKLAFLAPKDPSTGQCDAKCASKLLGSQLPHKINGF